MRGRVGVTVLAVLFVAGCGASATTGSTPEAAVSSTSEAAAVTEPATTRQTLTSSLSVNSQQHCAAARNELAESGIQDVMEQVLAGQQLPTIAFATPVKNYTRVPPDAAEPQVADAIIAVNRAVAELQSVVFTLWTSTQTAALAGAYKQLKSVCGLDGS